MRRLLAAFLVCFVLLAPSLLMGQARGVRKHVRLATDGLKLFQLGKDNEAARAKLLASIKEDSTYAPAYYTLARVYGTINLDSACMFSQKAYELDSTNRWYLSLYAQNALASNRLELAQKLYQNLSRLQPKEIDSYSVLSQIHQRMGQPHTAIAVLDSAELRLGRNQYLSNIKSRLLLSTMQHERAIEEAKQAIEEAPHIVDYRVAYADLLASLGRDSLALESYKQAFQTDSTHLKTLVSLAEFYDTRKNEKEYLNTLGKIIDHEDLHLEHKILLIKEIQSNRELYRKEYIQINSFITQLLIDYPESDKAVDLQINHLLSVGLVEEALNVSKIHLDRSEANFDYYRRVIDLERYLGRDDSLAHYLSRAMAIFPDKEELNLEWAHLLTVEKRYDEAVDNYHAHLKRASDSLKGVIWGLLGDLHQQIAADKAAKSKERKEFKKSCSAYEAALKINPRNEHVLNNYAYMLLEKGGDVRKAEKMSKITIEMDSDNSTYLDTYAWALHKQGRWEEAKTFMRKALALDGSQNGEIALHYGEILFVLDEKTMADFYWKKAVEWGIDPKNVDKSRERAKVLKSEKKQ